MWIYGGKIIDGGCSAGQGKQYALDGTLSACANLSTYSSGNDYFIDCDSGNDSTGDGSFATPWKTFRRWLTVLLLQGVVRQDGLI
jgi:hypothetical protein